RVQGMISMAALIANLIAIGASGFIIEAWGFSVFFYLMGGIVTITGLFVGMQIKEAPLSLEEQQQPKKPFMEDLILTFKLETVKKNPILYLLLLTMALNGIAAQISSPFLFVYIENFLEFSKEEVSLVGGGVILIVAIASVVYGMYSHRFHRKKMLFISVIIHSIFSIIFYFTREMGLIFVVMTFSLSSGMIFMIILNSWIQDLLPEHDRGKFQGIRMIFYVAIPMIFGPMIGSNVIKNYGIPTIDEFGTSGFIPTPEIFLFEGIIVLFALIPLFFIAKKHGDPVFAKK
ncbi:MAG: MFS transporter, partial [Promethearchaeota archaeon]